MTRDPTPVRPPTDLARPPATVTGLVVAGSVVLVALAVVAVVLHVDEPSPLGTVTDLLGATPVLALSLVPAAVALVAVRRADRPLLVVAMVLAVLAAPATIGAGLVAALLWLPAVVRLPRDGGPRPASTAAVVVLVAVLALAAVLAPSVHRDPVCWRFVEDADGQRTTTLADVGGRFPRGFAVPGLVGEETSGESVEIDPDTGEPLEGTSIVGEGCVSDHVRPVEALAGVLFGFGAVGAARWGAIRPG